MNQSGFFTAFFTLLLFTQGFSFPSDKNPDYSEDNPELGEDDTAADSDVTIAKEENTKPIQLLSVNSTLQVFPGEQIILPCETINGDDPVISWKKDGSDAYLFFGDSVMINDESDKRRIFRTNNNSLVIKNAKLEDAGIYICKIEATEVFPSTVMYTVRVSNQPQTLKISPSTFVVVNEKDELKLRCETTSNEDPITFIWSHGSHKLHSIRNGKGAEVHIKHATRHNAGFYQCLADFGPDKEPLHNVIDVTVKYAPEVEVLSDYVHSGVGQTANLTCVVHAFPPANITWYKKEGVVVKPIANTYHTEVRDGKHIHNLTLRDVQKQDFGKYLCKSANSLGSHQKEIELTGTPSRAIFFERNLKDDDKTIVLKWEVDSYSPVMAYELRYRKNDAEKWMKEMPKVTTGSGNNKYIAEHAIHNLEPDMYHFELRSQNKFGWSEYSITQSIEGPMPLMTNEIDSDYKLQKAAIGPNSAVSSQPIMFLIALLLVISPLFCKNL